MKISVGLATSSETISDCCRATDFGASSPSTMCSAVMIENDSTTLMVCAMPDRHPVAEQGEDRLEQFCQGRLANPAKRQTGHGDAELRRRDVAVRIVQRAPDGSCAAMPFGDQLVDARLAHRDQRELGGDEEPVGEDERQHGDQAEGDACRVHAGTVPD